MSLPTAAQWPQLLFAGDPGISKWFDAGPAQISVRAAVRSRSGFPPLTPDELNDWRSWLEPLQPPAEALAGLEKLARPGTVAVVTGQQAGLLGGPLYTLYKAAGAIAWAHAIERETGIPAVPVFWVASDDHDFAEVATARWLDRERRLRSWSAPSPAAGPGRSVSRVQLTPAMVADLSRAIRDALPGAPQLDELLHFVHSSADTTWEDQFTRLLLRTLGPLGLVPVAPRLGWLRRRAIAVIRSDIEGGTRFSGLLAESAQALAIVGVGDRAIHRNGNEANWFLEIGGIRGKATWHDDRCRVTHPATGESLLEASPQDLLARLEETPEAFSPNAALRPLVQDAALPTAAYVAGPSELIYHAQIGPLYAETGIFRPALIPRPGAVLIEPPVRRAAQRLGLEIEEAYASGPEAIARAASRHGDEFQAQNAVRKEFETIREALARAGATIDGAGRDTAIHQAYGRLLTAFDGRAEQLTGRLANYFAQQAGHGERWHDTLVHSLWPDGSRQERHLGWINLLAQWGMQAPVHIAQALAHNTATLQLLDLAELPGLRTESQPAPAPPCSAP
ncbi:MAG: bacillithiol biosynthesis cysteine-adding enzyme BshC [Sumerlaeia bacterium]